MGDAGWTWGSAGAAAGDMFSMSSASSEMWKEGPKHTWWSAFA